MKILLVAATKIELDPILKQLNGKFCSSNNDLNIIFKGLSIDVLITGIGLVFTCFHLTNALMNQKYDLVINLGIAGSYNRSLQIGEIVNVTEEKFCDLGIESPIEFNTIFESGLCDKNIFPFEDGRLLSNYSKIRQLESIKQVNSISSNTAHGKESTINALIKKFNPDVESMEGAAFFYVCQMGKVNFIQIRAISNYVEPRNVKNWNIPLALENLTVFLIGFLDDLSKNQE